MKIITICNFKGGVGKTTLLTGFARTLAQNNFSILLIDLDPQANLTSVFKKDNNENIGSEQWFKSPNKIKTDDLINCNIPQTYDKYKKFFKKGWI